MADREMKCKAYKPWNEVDPPLNTKECFWLGPRYDKCESPLARYHTRECPWKGYPEGTKEQEEGGD